MPSTPRYSCTREGISGLDKRSWQTSRVPLNLLTSSDPRHPTRFIIHGSFDYSHWMKDMKDKLLENEEANVVIVDWSTAASKSFTDIQRLSHSRDVGFQVTSIVEDFMRIHGLNPCDVHIIAYGDGTFAADVVGQRVQGIGRISGLNPSGPVPFEHLPPDQRLDRTDAAFVDIIHTDDVTKSISPAKKGHSHCHRRCGLLPEWWSCSTRLFSRRSR